MNQLARPRKRRPRRQKKRRFERLRRLVAATPPAIRTLTVLIVAAILLLAANLAYHVIRKPTEMLFPVSGLLKKSPAETWRDYGPLFREYSTAAISPELLAALAQIEGGGDPIAHTYWRLRPAWPPFEIYKPASSAVGLYQMTDGTFADAQAYCIRGHVVIARGPACPSEAFYNRLLPSHAIELTAAHLDRAVTAILGRTGDAKATPRQKQALAALTHLCGAGIARGFAAAGFKLAPEARCGDHPAPLYLERVEAMIGQFQRMSPGD